MPSDEAANDFAAARARLIAALGDVANGDTRAIKALYSHGDDATSFYGWGGYEKGWAEVDRRWDWAGTQFQGGSVAHHPVTQVVGRDLAYTTDIETFRVRMAGKDGVTEWSNRVTHVFRREADGWRLVHRHANRLEDRYAPATRLR